MALYVESQFWKAVCEKLRGESIKISRLLIFTYFGQNLLFSLQSLFFLSLTEMSNTQRPSPGRSPEENIATVWWQAAWPKLKRKQAMLKVKYLTRDLSGKSQRRNKQTKFKKKNRRTVRQINSQQINKENVRRNCAWKENWRLQWNSQHCAPLGTGCSVANVRSGTTQLQLTVDM